MKKLHAIHQSGNRDGFHWVIVIGAALVGVFFGWHIGMNYGEKSARAEFADRLDKAERLNAAGQRELLLRNAQNDRLIALSALARAEREIVKYSEQKK